MFVMLRPQEWEGLCAPAGGENRTAPFPLVPDRYVDCHLKDSNECNHGDTNRCDRQNGITILLEAKPSTVRIDTRYEFLHTLVRTCGRVFIDAATNCAVSSMM